MTTDATHPCNWCSQPIAKPRVRHDRCYEECSAKAAALVRELSNLFKKNGLPRGGRYAPFGYTAAGVKVSNGSSNGTCAVEAFVYVVGAHGNIGDLGTARRAAEVVAAAGKYVIDRAPAGVGSGRYETTFHVTRAQSAQKAS